MADSTAVQPAAGNEQAGGQQGAPQQQAGTWSMLKGFAIRMIIIYVVSSYFRKGNAPPPPNAKPGEAAATAAGYLPAKNMFDPLSYMDIYIYVTESSSFSFEKEQDLDSLLFWRIEDFQYGNWDLGDVTKEQELQLSQSQINNGTIYLHLFVARAGYPVDPRAAKYSAENCFSRTFRLNKYKKRVFKETRNLITGETTAEKPTTEKARNDSFEILSFWHPNLTVSLVDDHTAWQRAGVPAMFNEFIQFDPSGSVYQPIVFFNNFWNLQSDYMPVNDTTPTVLLRLSVSHLSMFKWQMYVSQTQRSSWYRSMFANEYLGDVSELFDESDEEQDALKRTLIETNFYLLVVTVAVSLLHTVFEFLAFKNDIQFWRSRKTLEGLSVRTVLFSVFCSLIVVLYVFDNEANFLVKMSVVVSLLIDLWKIKKVVNVELHTYQPFGAFRVKFFRLVDKSSYVNSGTKQYDQLAFRYLSWAFFPLIIAYAVYSLLYVEHKSWFSFIISMLYGFLLTFGFIMMTPQLFINYKLKSVAHLPWRMLTYKFLNTFIDDLFAFVIHMPTLYRLGCLRDDVIFIIYLYQRWIYPIDHRRTNEFGVSGEDLTEAETQSLQQSPEAEQQDQSETSNGQSHAQDEHLKSE